MSEHVWYASYGSNLSADRFSSYLRGGRPTGAARTYPGARDHTPASADRAVQMPGAVFFGWESSTWGGGGVAFLDPDADGVALARAYRITADQFADVLTQEMHRPPSVGIDLAPLERDGRLTLGTGRYETLVLVDRLDDEPVVTFTCPSGDRRPFVNAPSATYLRLIASGLRETHGLGVEEIVDYLAPLEGVYAGWSRDELARVLAQQTA